MADYLALMVNEQEQPSATCEIVATLGRVEELPLDGYGTVDWQRIDIAKVGFGMLKVLEMRHPEHSSKVIQLHPPGEHDLEVRLSLEPGEEVVGFQVKEVKDGGASEFYDPQVLIRDATAVRMEPLSQQFFKPSPEFPGKLRWLPATAQPDPEGKVQGSEVVGFRAIQGVQRDHILGVVHKVSFWSFDARSWTGQSVMFWIDIFLLVLVLYYADILLDLKQLKVFADQRLYDYLRFNALGLLIPPVLTVWEACHWLQQPSPERDHFDHLVASKLMQKIIIVLAVATQTHVILLVMWSVRFKQKHPLLQGAKNAETMAVSILVSCCSTGLSFAGKDKKDGSVLGLPGKVDWSPTMVSLVLVRAMETASRMVAFNIVQVSLRGGWCGHLGGPMAVLFFVAAAGLCFPEAEISDVLASVVAHPGQILEPQSLLPLWRSLVLHALLILVALLPQVLLRTEYKAWMPKDAKEIPAIYLLGWLAVTACSFLGLMILYLLGRRLKQPIFEQLREGDERGGSIPLSSFIAAFAGKQGQVPKAVAAALGDDVVRVDIANLDKVTLTELMTSQCPVSFSREAFKHLIRLYGKDIDFEGDRDESAEIAPAIEEVMSDLALCNVVRLDLTGCSFIPAAAWQRLHGADWRNLKIARFDLWCFAGSSKGVDDAADLLQVLGKATTLEELVFYDCTQIPAAAWQRLHGADWRNLKIARFDRSFGLNRKGVDGAGDLLQVLGKATTLEELVFCECNHIPAAAWQRLHGADWRNLKIARFDRCFGLGSKGVDGAADLLQVLGKATTLETLVFEGCSQIPAAAWQRLHGADWRNLKIARFDRCFGDDSKGVNGAADLLQVLGKAMTLEELDFEGCSQIPAAAWQRLHGADWRNLKIARFDRCFGDDSKGVNGAADLLQVLGKAMTLEELDFEGCSQIPAAAWQRLHGADWRNLKIASFVECFDDDSKGVDGAADLLQVLGKAMTLERLDFDDCSQIPAAAWQRVPSGAWPKLKPRKAPGVPAEELQRFVAPSGGVASEHKEDREVATKVAMPGPRHLKVVRARNLEANKGDALLQGLSQSTTLETLDFDSCDQIPAAAWQRLHGADWRNLKIASFVECFGDDSKGVDGAADLLQVLGKATTLEELVFHRCNQIPAAAWQRLHGANWRNLKIASFVECFGLNSKGVDGAADLLQVLGKATTLEELAFHRCNQIPAAAWQRLHGADWRNLKIARFDRCFDDDSKGVDGAADLLQVLGKAMTLEELDFDRCSQIPAAAWQRLHGADWRNLKIARFDRCFGNDSKGVDGAADLLQVLGKATTLEELVFHRCNQIPAAAWQRLHGANWRNLKIASFVECFGLNSKGVDGAADLLQVLGKATTLEELAFHRCNQIPAAAWQRVPSGAWPKLKPSKTPGVPEEELQRICGDGRQGWAHAETSAFSCRFVRHWSVAEKECR
ncbi:unnamed protein product [Cladocopium goreaui]|uniref:Uncharacterized protein n=1 Tax=Cladocopium goreaui TaxID=2562237 RepID=A0A9P1CWZ8_9DINO|nr:unnamed protein product [Cladocopium goreaui]